MKKILLIAAAITMSGCVTTTPMIPITPQKEMRDVALNVAETKTLGEPMIVTLDGLAYPAFVAIENAVVPNVNYIVSFTPIHAGDAFTCDRQVMGKNIYYCSNPSFIAHFNIPSVGCVLIDESGKLAGRGSCIWDGVNDYMTYNSDQVTFKKDINFKGFRKELLYNGKTGNTIKLQYREFNNDMIRPAFSQDLSFDLSESPTIGFRGMKIDVTKATNSDITFIVRSLMSK